MPLTSLQRKKLIEDCNKINIKTLMTYIQSGEITMDDLPKLSPDRRQEIEKLINEMPNDLEQQEWAHIKAQLDGPKENYDNALLQAIADYIRRWEGSRPTGNHVDEANQCYMMVERVLMEKTIIIEEKDWQQVDAFSKLSLMNHLTKYPNTSHKDDIDDTVWDLTNKDLVPDIQDYLTVFPNGRHAIEAKAMLDGIVEWETIRNTGDVFTVNDYIRNNPDSPFMQQAKLALMSLKQQEINQMRTEPNRYEVERLFRLLNEGIVSDSELIRNEVVTPGVLETLKNTDILNDLPDINQAIKDSTPECKDGYTDVYFFGVPSTGKTCVLMGLSRSHSLNINLAHGGGDYAAALQQYTDVGITVPATPGDFVTTMEATISSNTVAGAKHKVNLVEMSGEEFAFGIANNPDHVFTFEDMGTGATKLLSNNNRKVFFLIIDPTTNLIHFSHKVTLGYDEETGQKITETKSFAINQQTLIQKMVNIFQNPSNADIMKKVDSIHIIVTKSDTLGEPLEREARALQIFRERFQNSILGPLIELCETYNINTQMAKRYHPNLYTFSLGKFYVGRLYEYDYTDADRLVTAIRNSTQGEKKKSFWDKVKDVVN